MRASLFASQAPSLMETIVRPGGTIHPFCDPVTTTSKSHSSVLTGTAPRLETASTKRSFPCRFTTRAISQREFITPVEVSLWTMRTAFTPGSLCKAYSTRSASTASPKCRDSRTTFAPYASARQTDPQILHRKVREPDLAETKYLRSPPQALRFQMR